MSNGEGQRGIRRSFFIAHCSFTIVNSPLSRSILAGQPTMRRCLLLLTPPILLPGSLHADAFDNYTNPILTKVPTAAGVKEIKQLTPDLIADNDSVLPSGTSAFVVVRTNDNRFSKLTVQPARQKVDAGRTVPILMIDRFVTYKEGEERTVQASGHNVYLFPGFRFNLDIGQ